MSVVICTGVQKAGTHLLYKVVDLLGVPNHSQQFQDKADGKRDRISKQWFKDDGYCLHRHLPHHGKQSILDRNPDTKFVVILRDPRNVFISRVRRVAMREKQKGTFQDIAIKCLFLKNRFGSSIIDPKRQLQWLGWLSDQDACCVRFEDLRGSKGTIINTLNKIRLYLGTDVDPRSVLHQIEGGTGTWSGRNSNWEEHWSTLIDIYFRRIGGFEVVKTLGYSV